MRKRIKWQASCPGDWAVAAEPDRTASAGWKKKSRIMRRSCHREDERKMSVADYFSRCSDMWSTPPPSSFALSLSPKATAQLLAMDRPRPAEKRGAVESGMTIYALKKMCVSPTCARPLPQQKNFNQRLAMNDRETRTSSARGKARVTSNVRRNGRRSPLAAHRRRSSMTT